MINMHCTDPDCPICNPKITQCRSCKADIIWIKLNSGKMHPVNAKPKKVFIPYFIHDAVHAVTDKKKAHWKIKMGYESHFATCPDSNRWRKDKK